MSQSTLPDLNESGTDDASDDDQNDEIDIECACELGAPGCFEHYEGGSRLEEDND